MGQLYVVSLYERTNCPYLKRGNYEDAIIEIV